MIHIAAGSSCLCLSMLYPVTEYLRCKYDPSLYGVVIRAHPAQMSEIKMLTVMLFGEAQKARAELSDFGVTDGEVLKMMKWLFFGDANFEYDEKMPKNEILFRFLGNDEPVGKISELAIPCGWTNHPSDSP